MDPNSARRNMDELFDKAMLELKGVFSSDDEIKKEMQDAVKRAIQRHRRGIEANPACSCVKQQADMLPSRQL